MIPMKCTKALRYAGRPLKPGDEFQARGEKDARVLVAIGKAARVTTPDFSPVVGAYSTRMMSAPRAAVMQAAGDGLDAMDRDALHALAAERGVKVHHMAGAAKVREALRKAAE